MKTKSHPFAFISLSKKLAIFMLAFLLVFQPALVAFADEVGGEISGDTTGVTDTTSGDDSSSSTTTTEDTSGDQTIDPIDQTDTEETTLGDTDPIDETSTEETTQQESNSETQSLISGVDVPPTVYQVGQNKQTLSPEIDKTTGELNYQYPITLPPGRNNLTPDIAIAYNSSRQNNDSIVGYGWTVSIPYIQRLNKTGTENLYSTNNYTSSLSGELSLVSGSTWGARSEDTRFLNYQYSSNTWTVKDKNGTTYVFGGTAQARQDDPSDSTHIYKWMLESVTDTNGNVITYNYYKNGGQIYPSTIDYDSNGASAALFQVEFERESQPYPTKIASPAFVVTTNYRIKTIIAKFNNDWVKKYALAYTTTAENNRSLLASIQESGKDESSNVVTLPATTLSYTTNNGSYSWVQDTGWHDGPFFAGPTITSPSNIINKFADINGDGFVDGVCAGNLSNNSCGVSLSPAPTMYFFNTGQGWNETTSGPTIPIGFLNEDSGEDQKDQGVRLLDVNGDGLTDFLFGHNQDYFSEDYPSRTYLNGSGTTWSLASAYTNNTPMFTGSAKYDFGVDQFEDINGDGLTDVICATTVGWCLTGKESIYRNNGTGWTISTNTYNTKLPWYFDYKKSTGEQRDSGIKLIDFNGDQLGDLVWSASTTIYGSSYTDPNTFYLNNGVDWIEDTAYPTLPYLASGGSSPEYNHQFGDVNGDGLVDIVCSNTMGEFCWNLSDTASSNTSAMVYANNGYGVTPIDASSSGIPSFTKEKTTTNDKFLTAYLVDMNGDGLSDVVEGYDLNSETVKGKVYINQGIKSQLLKSITIPAGSQTNITYKPSTYYRDGSNNLLNPNLAQVVYTVSSIVTNPGLADENTTSYTYADGYYYYNTAFDRKFAGFGTVTATDSVGNVTKTYYHQGNATNTTLGEYDDHVSKIGMAYRIEEYDNSGNLYRLTVNKIDKYNIGTNHDFAKLVRQYLITYDGNSSHKDKVTEYTYNNTNGNLTQKIDWGEVTVASNGTFTDVGTDKLTQAISYATNSTTGVNVPSIVTTTDISSNKVKESKYYYDTLANGSVDKGNQTKVEDWVTGSTYINNQKAYNSYGLVTSATDPRSKVTSYSYDTYNLYPATVTDALTHTTQYIYDYSSGKVKQKTDQNSFVYQTTYDGLDRVLEEKIPDFTSPYSAVTKTAYAYTDTQNAVAIHKTDTLDSSTAAETYKYFDGLNRLIQERKEAETTNTYNTKDVAYDSRGLTLKESLQYASTGTSKTSPTTTSSLYTNYTYDPLNRILTKIDALGTTSYAYDDWKTTVTDANSKVKKYYKDASDNLIKVDEIKGASTYTTNYEWDLNKKLTKITDALSNIRNFTYDGLGRRLTAEDLHASGDSTFGSWSYAYDNASNTTQSVSPNALTVNYTYDDLNRVLTEDYTGGSGTEVTYTYDSCTNGVGKLCSVVVTGGATSAYTYDSNANIASDIETINSNAYTTSYTYDRLGNTVIITYPDNAQAKYVFDSAGGINKVRGKESGGSFADLVATVDYNPNNLITTLSDSNGVTTTNTYDATKNYRLTNKLTQKSGGPKLQDLTYTYDNVNNITKIVDASGTNSAKTVDYVYDDLYRLTSATATNTANSQNYTHTYTYDAVGNILTGPLGTYLYQGNTGSLKANPHAATSINSVTYTYDSDGNLTANGTLTNTFDYRDQLTQSVIGSTTVNNYYDYQGNRARYKVGSVNTYYPNKFYNTDGTKKTKQVYLGDLLVATTETVSGTATPYFVHTDNVLGSSVITDTSGVKNQLLDYYPYGDIRLNEQAGSFNEQKKFGGHIYDTDTDLNYFGARYYLGKTGRFISQDPSFLSLGDESLTKATTGQTLSKVLMNPQSLNSYSYAENNPIVKIDPNGKFVQYLIPAAIYAVVTYGPQIYSLLQSLNTPIAQVAIGDAINNFGKGNYGAAVFAGITVGEFPEGKIVKGLWTEGRFKTGAENAISHFEKHGQEFGVQNAKQYVEKAREFFNNPGPGTLIGSSLKNSNSKIYYNEISNTLGVINSKGIPQSLFKPINGMQYFQSQVKSFIKIYSKTN